MKLRANLIAVVLFVLALAVFAAALKVGHPASDFMKGFSSGA
jgi:hypothetical protein